MQTMYSYTEGISNPDCKIKLKFSSFGSYTDLGSIPSEFTDLIKKISCLVFPNDFSVTYYDNKMTLLQIDNSETYCNLVEIAKEQKFEEIKFFVNLYKNHITNKDTKLADELTIIPRQTSVILKESNNSDFGFIKEQKYFNKRDSYKERNCKTKSYKNRNYKKNVRSPGGRDFVMCY